MAVIEDDEPTLLLAKHEERKLVQMQLEKNMIVSSLLTMHDAKASETNLWYLDNGANNHMTGFKSKFTELNEKVTGQVCFGDGSMVKIEGKGIVMFVGKNGEEYGLREVYYIPNLKTNIISTGQLSEDGNSFIIRGEFLWVFNQRERLLMKVKRSENRLYIMVIETSNKECLMTKEDEASKLWHVRLGHVNYQAMSLMSKQKMVIRMPRTVQPKTI